MVSILTSKSPFISSTTAGSQADSRTLFSRSDSDLISALTAYQAWKAAKTAGSAQAFCRKNRLSDQNFGLIEEQKIQLLVYLVDAGLAALEREESTVLNRARTRTSTGQHFYQMPPRFNRNVDDGTLCSIVAMAFYPRILVRQGNGWRNIYTTQYVTLTPRSVNYGSLRPPKWLSFYEAVQTRTGNLNVFESTRIPESALATLLGDAEFKLFSGVIALDGGRIRLSVRYWKQLLALKILRGRILAVLDHCYRQLSEPLSESAQKWVKLWLKTQTSQSETRQSSLGVNLG